MTTKQTSKTNKPAKQTPAQIAADVKKAAPFIAAMRDGFKAIYNADVQIAAYAERRSNSTVTIEGACYSMNEAGIRVPAQRKGNRENMVRNVRDAIYETLPEQWSKTYREHVLGSMADVINGVRDKFVKNWTVEQKKSNKKKGGDKPKSSMIAIPKTADDLDAVALLVKLFENMQKDTPRTQSELGERLMNFVNDIYDFPEADDEEEAE